MKHKPNQTEETKISRNVTDSQRHTICGCRCRCPCRCPCRCGRRCGCRCRCCRRHNGRRVAVLGPVACRQIIDIHRLIVRASRVVSSLLCLLPLHHSACLSASLILLASVLHPIACSRAIDSRQARISDLRNLKAVPVKIASLLLDGNESTLRENGQESRNSEEGDGKERERGRHGGIWNINLEEHPQDEIYLIQSRPRDDISNRPRQQIRWDAVLIHHHHHSGWNRVNQLESASQSNKSSYQTRVDSPAPGPVFLGQRSWHRPNQIGSASQTSQSPGRFGRIFSSSTKVLVPYFSPSPSPPPPSPH